jgi:hypothetical protein
MTLAARRTPHPSHSKRTGRHQHQRRHFKKTYWPYLPMLMIVGLGLIFNALWPSHQSVMGYATDISAGELLDDTNQQRAAHGKKALTINLDLTQAATAKAEDMAARDYWSHNTPDGRTPWTFITKAGYDYQTAGENLAYGFATSDDTTTAWMNSPEHRANILNSTYTNVGFGVINIKDYQGSGPQTLVVAMYASPEHPQLAAAPSQPAEPAASSPAPASASQSQPSAPLATKAEAKPAAKTTTRQDTATPTKPAQAEPQPQTISRVQLVANGQADWSVIATLIVLTVALALLIIRHGFAWHKYLVRGEHFVLKHPTFDFAALAIVMIGVVLTHSVGVIR